MILTFFHTTGGLASPPDSRINSPFIPIGATSGSHLQKLAPPQFVNPRDLHDSSYLSEVEVGHRDEDNSTEEMVARADDDGTKSPTSLLLSSDLLVVGDESQKLSSDSTEAEALDEMDVVESEKPVSDSLEGDKGDPMIVNEVDETVATRPVSDSLDGDKDDAMIGVESKEETVGVDPTKPVSDSLDGGKGDAMIGVEPKELLSDSTDVEGDELIVVESKELSNSLTDYEGHPSNETRDSTEDDDLTVIPVEKDNPAISAELNKMSTNSNSSVHQTAQFEPCRSSRNAPLKPIPSLKSSDLPEDVGVPVIHVEEANPGPTITDELNKMSLDSNLSVHQTALFEPRRSSRNALVKDVPSLKVAAPPKSSSGKRKAALKKDVITLQASFWNNSIYQNLTK